MRFFVFEPDIFNVQDFTEFHPIDESRVGDAPRCPKCGCFIGMLPLLQPIQGKLETWGSEYGDIACCSGDEILVSMELLNDFKQSGLKGLFDVGPVKITGIKSHRKLRKQMPIYHCCRVLQGRAAVDDIRSRRRVEEPSVCEECREGFLLSIDQIAFEENTWAGEDVFYPRGLAGFIIASENFRKLCERYHVLWGKFIPVEEYSYKEV